jgi:ubiquinone/menaquinone biosynthesis C-methylase UbiE
MATTSDLSPRQRSLLRRFIDANIHLSGKWERRFTLESDKPFWQRFADLVNEEAGRLPENGVVVDLGGGRQCVFRGSIPRDRGVSVVAVDISADELALNKQVDKTVVADVADTLPFNDASVDLLVSRALLEHVDGVPQAARNMSRVLKPGGVALHFIPARYSLFGIFARTMPFKPTLWLLHRISPKTRGQVEFKVYYDHCYASAIEKAFLDAGFSKVNVETCWSQSDYFFALFPLYVAVSLYQGLVRRLQLRDLAAYLIVRAER